MGRAVGPHAPVLAADYSCVNNSRLRFISPRRALELALLITLSVALVTGTPASTVEGASFTVDSLGDEPDATPGDGACQTAGSDCTLRAAAEETSALSGSHSVTFSVVGAINLSAHLSINPLTDSDSVTIQGPGAATLTVDGGGNGAVFVVCGAV